MSGSSAAFRGKNQPMIVDVAINPDGRKLYKVHETTNSMKDATPNSGSYSDTSRFLFDSVDDARSPVSCTSSNSSPLPEKEKSSDSASSASQPETQRRCSNKSRYKSSSSSSNGDNIWSKDVQNAFEEALAIVPKNGLNKIKIGGKSCGRNELISDFILAKTGKLRSRKQVSSHIQVIKNMSQMEHLISLINDGPTFSSTQEAEENNRKFEEIFSKVNMNKSLGLTSVENSQVITTDNGLRRHSSANLGPAVKRRKSPSSILNVKNIHFAIDHKYPGAAPLMLSTHSSLPMKLLSVKNNAEITNRFPGLEEFASTTVPIIHNMVKILSPLSLPNDFSIDTGLKTNYHLELSNSTESLSSFTTVFSFGMEVLKVNEESFKVNTDQPFLLKFWKCFFLQLCNQPSSLETAFKGVCVKQVIYENSGSVPNHLPKSKIRAILLWEFSKVDNPLEAVASTSRLFLPPDISEASVSVDNNNYCTQPSSKYNPSSHNDHLQHQTEPQPSLQSHPSFIHGSTSYSEAGSRLLDNNQLSSQSFGTDVNFQASHSPAPIESQPTFSYFEPGSFSHPAVNLDLGSMKNHAQEEFQYTPTFYY